MLLQAADLPKVNIVRDIEGGASDAPLGADFRNVLLTPIDAIGPYLTSASFSLNPTHGDTTTDLVENQKAILTLNFSEEVDDEDFGASSFSNGGNFNSAICLRDMEVSPDAPSSTFDLILDDDALPNIPFDPTGATNYQINLVNMSDVQDEMENDSSDDRLIDIIDTTPVWVDSANIILNGGTGDLEITINFGKRVNIDTDIIKKENNLISIDGDPNMPMKISTIANGYTYRVDVTSDKNSDWTPTVSFDLDPDNTIIQDFKTGAPETNDLTEDFSVVVDDKVPARITNIDPAGMLFAYEMQLIKQSDNSFKYLIEVPIKFSEPINPAIWDTPTKAYKYFINASPPYTVESFVTSGQNSCGGNTLTIEILSDVSIGTVALPNLTITFANDPKRLIEDLNENKGVLAPATFSLKPGQLSDVWSVPLDVDNGEIAVGPIYMKIIGVVYDVTGDPIEGAGSNPGQQDAVYAFSRQNLFRKDLSGDEVVNISYDVSHDRCFGAANINTDGSYHMNVYGKTGSSDGFVSGEPVILVVMDHNPATGATPDYIATTACLSNTEYSVAFKGGYVPVVRTQDIYLGKRESVKVKPGWNLISSSIDTAFVDPIVCADTGLSPSDFEGYIYGPNDTLTGPGSSPANVYDMSSAGNRDSSALLFTIAHPDLKNTIYAPYSAYGIADGLDDTLNNLPVFGPGLAFYVYIDSTLADATSATVSDWEIVLFGDKIPGPEYKVKVDTSPALVGHWGSNLYYKDKGQTIATRLDNNSETELPSTYSVNTQVYVDDVCVGEGSKSYLNDFALTVTDTTGTVVNVNSVSTYFNYSGFINLLGPSVWWGTEDLIDLGDLAVMPPGCGLWIEINDGVGPYFVNYMTP